MAHGLALDHAAWSSPWRTRSLRDKAVLSGGLLLSALVLPPVPGGVLVAIISIGLLLGPIRVGVGRLLRVVAIPVVSILIGVATLAVSVNFDGGVRLAILPAGIQTASTILVRSLAATLAMFTLACSTPMIDLLSGLRRLRVPDPLIEIAALIYRFIFGLLESVVAIRQAQVARLGNVSRRAEMRSASSGTTMLLARAWTRARALEDGLAGRGYTDTLRTLEPATLRSATFLTVTIGSLAGVAAVSLAWGLVA